MIMVVRSQSRPFAGQATTSCLRSSSSAHASTFQQTLSSSSSASQYSQRPFYGQQTSHTSLLKPLPPIRRQFSTSSTLKGEEREELAQSDHNQPPLQQLTRLRTLVREADATNKMIQKAIIIREYPDLKDLLFKIYAPHTRLNLTSTALSDYLLSRAKDHDWEMNIAPKRTGTSVLARRKSATAAKRAQAEREAAPPDTLLELFDQLERRGVTGNRALALVTAFLNKHGVIKQHEEEIGKDEPGFEDKVSTEQLIRRTMCRPTVLELFYRCLDRNLKAGFSNSIIGQAYPGGQPDSSRFSSNSGEKNERWEADGNMGKKFEVALGKTVSRDELQTLFSDMKGEWYASRKLDGVRCVTFIDFRLPLPGEAGKDAEIEAIMTLSRNGRTFNALANLKEDLSRHLRKCPHVLSLLKKSVDEDSKVAGPQCSNGKMVARLVIDGEVCAIVSKKEASPEAAKVHDQEQLLHSEEAQKSALSESQPFVEDFHAIVGALKRKDFQVEKPAYFPFDLLTYSEFTFWRSSGHEQPGEQAHRRFGERIKSLKEVVSWCRANGSEALRHLDQTKVENADHITELVGQAAERHWEGIILRNDDLYEGKRSSSIRKFKEWHDAEYVVTGVETATMRLPVDGTYAERNALAAILIEHRGSKVAVGSGFTVEQRLRYAADSSLIIGKQVTVEYFEESQTHSDSQGKSQSVDGAESGTNYSLRFPRLKTVWEEGERDV